MAVQDLTGLKQGTDSTQEEAGLAPRTPRHTPHNNILTLFVAFQHVSPSGMSLSRGSASNLAYVRLRSMDGVWPWWSLRRNMLSP